MKRRTPKAPSWKISLIPIISLIAILFVVVRTFGADSLSGASQFSLILAAGIGIGLSMLVCGCSWKQLEDAIIGNIKASLPASSSFSSLELSAAPGWSAA